MKLSPRFLYPLVFVAGAAIGVGVYFAATYLVQKSTARPLPSLPPADALTAPQQLPPTSIPTPETATSTAEPSTTDLAYVTSTQAVDRTTARLRVKWFAKAQEYSIFEATQVFSGVGIKSDLFTKTLETPDPGLSVYYQSYAGMWRLGTVDSGAFAGADVLLLLINEEGMGAVSRYYRLLVPHDGSTPRIIAGIPDAESNPGLLVDRLIVMPNVTYADPFPGEHLTLPNGKILDHQQILSFFDPNTGFFLDASTTKYVISKEGFQIYRNGDMTAVQSVAPDGQVLNYISRISGKRIDSGTVIPDITWTNGGMNTQKYADTVQSGCGGSFEPRIVSDNVPGNPQLNVASLSVVGKTRTGDLVYAPKDPVNDVWVQGVYDMWYVPDGNKPKIEVFLQKYSYPVLFWKDAFDRWVTMQVSDSIPPAECGKPVIYLYPEKTTNVSVKLPSFIDVTKSEPAYPSKGWNVTAQPNGDLTMADGSSYGSLYWEGTGVGYEAPKTGFIVKDGETASFFAMTLKKYGLNEKESREFRDFWVPKMTGAPFYRVSFLTNDWSKAAPLLVSPKPATSIRIFMDWQKLNAPISIEAPKIVTPKRDGFTLVEWGGLLWK